MADLIYRYTSAHSLRSDMLNFLSGPRTRLRTRGDRGFEAAALKLWDVLPAKTQNNS